MVVTVLPLIGGGGDDRLIYTNPPESVLSQNRLGH